MRRSRKIVVRLFGFVACLFAVLALSEFGARFLVARSPQREWLRMFFAVNHRLWALWLQPKQAEPLLPPFPVYSNRGLDDPERLRAVFTRSRLPPNGSWRVRDFLRSPAAGRDAEFDARSNSLGFRDPPRSRAKPARTYRVICLGAYQTFGLGVNDDDSYARQLERRLNARRGARVYEVWNGGVPAASAIMGLSRLNLEIFDYSPDMLILDYGFVDLAALGDDLMPVMLLLPSSGPVMRAIKFLLRRFVLSPMSRLYILHMALQKFLMNQEGSAERWSQTMTRMLALARHRGIPVILLDQGRTLAPENAYRQLAAGNPDVFFVSVREEFRRHPPSQEQRTDFTRRPNWSQEFGSSLEGAPGDTAYFVDIFHPNPLGHARIAAALSDVVWERSHHGR